MFNNAEVQIKKIIRINECIVEFTGLSSADNRSDLPVHQQVRADAACSSFFRR